MKALLVRRRMRKCWAVIAAGMLLVGLGATSPDGVLAEDVGAAGVAPMGLDRMSLEQLMERMGDDFRQLKRSVRDESQRDATLDTLVDMQLVAIVARLKQPVLKDVPEDQVSAYMLDYQLRLIELSRKLLDAEQAVREGRTSDAFDAVKAMAILQREGHEKFKVDEE